VDLWVGPVTVAAQRRTLTGLPPFAPQGIRALGHPGRTGPPWGAWLRFYPFPCPAVKPGPLTPFTSPATIRAKMRTVLTLSLALVLIVGPAGGRV